MRVSKSRSRGVLQAGFKPPCVYVCMSRESTGRSGTVMVVVQQRSWCQRGSLKDPRVHHGGLPIPLLIRWKEKAGDVKEDGMW